MNNALLTRSYQALIYDEIEEYEQTIADLSAHLQTDPTNTHALNNRAVAHGEIGHIDEALEGFRAAAAADPTNAVPHVNMAGCSNNSVTSARPLQRIAPRCSGNLRTCSPCAVAPWHCARQANWKRLLQT